MVLPTVCDIPAPVQMQKNKVMNKTVAEAPRKRKSTQMHSRKPKLTAEYVRNLSRKRMGVYSGNHQTVLNTSQLRVFLRVTVIHSSLFWDILRYSNHHEYFRDILNICHISTMIFPGIWDFMPRHSMRFWDLISGFTMAHHVGQPFTQVSESAGSLLCLEREARFLYGHEAGPKMSWSFGGKPSRNTKTKKWGIQWNLRVLNGMEQYIYIYTHIYIFI